MERMNWLSRLASRGPGHRAPQGASLQTPVMADPETCLMVFKNHWSQVVRILERQGPRAAPGGADDLSAVRNHTYQMLTLLVEDRAVPSAPTAPGPLLEFALREDLLTRVLAWQLQWDELGDGVEERRAEQLKLFEMLVSEARQPLLRHSPVREALLTLLDACGRPVPSSPVLDEGLVLLLSQLCVCLAREPSLLEFFLQPPPEPGAAPRLLLFSRLVPFVHREGTLGQQARDALLLLMALSAGSPTVGRYIADHSYFCPVLATGLSALYSSLPRKIEVPGDDWHCLRREDWLGVPALALFMSSLEFCNAVIQVAHPLVQKQLVDYIHNGFLVPVMGPALHKTSVEEMIASTAYLELFLRSISEPALLRTFLRFLLLHRHDTHTILDTLVARIGSNSRLCMVSLSLFRTLLNLSCEDVLLQLVLRYLVPCNHVMLSQKPAVRDVDLYGRAADKFLSLIPRCCRHRAPSPPRPEHASWARGPGSPSVDSSSVVTVPRPSTPSRLALFLRQQSLGGSESPVPAPRSPGLAASPASSPGRRPSPVEEPGPFMAVLFAKLENMLQNSVYVNFLLTGLVAQLACHPQPLLRSFLLNTNMVFQPSVKSLLQVLGSVKNKIESFAASQEDFPALLSKAKKYLIARGKLDWAEGPAAGPAPRRSDPLVKSRRPSLGELLLRHAHSPTRARQAAQLVLQPGRDGAGLGLGGGSPGASTPVLPPRGGAPERQGEALRVKNAVYCAVIFPEFLKELAAISQAHAVTSPFLLDTSEEGSGLPVSGFGPLNP
ncbi:FHF complex subunit HOOK-interacting protein 1B isoform X10 [Ursus arctos]|uniref:FHF complex subunit HOOK-interacting protein 1B isoform X10 n=1 Tax=Ursus arctos TaxID=9644 RepID=UPI002016C175|nr:FHF complex subunit HOOK-interacting protein 1B isoform X10 [Ursus arctos]XP_048073424.1 FHF complex subunit HOOK-interacting protein 1B isoform X10 [Ursus arctos]XP_057172910.1 FHF complex subunit HOOK-interacting protein 1B isoform X10 [Ursus arctos]